MRTLIKEHYSLLMPIVGAASAFLANLLLKSALEPKEYGQYAALILTITTFFVIGSLGYEQLLIRLIKVKDKKNHISSHLIIAGAGVLIASPFISYLLMSTLGVTDKPDSFFIMCSLLIPISTLLATFYKISGDLNAHYMLMNTWKLCFFISVSVFIFLLKMPFNNTYLLSSLCIGFIASISLAKRTDIIITNDDNTKSIIKYLIAGMISIAGYAIFDGLDRFIIKANFNSETFGDYFFIFTFFMSPIGILSMYYSTRRLPFYKENFNITRMRKDYINVLIISTITATSFYFFLNILVWGEIVFLSSNYTAFIISVLLLAIIRGAYSILSISYSVICSSNTLMFTGVFFGITSLIVFFATTKWLVVEEVLSCIYLFILLWLFRSAIYLLLIKFEVRQNNES